MASPFLLALLLLNAPGVPRCGAEAGADPRPEEDPWAALDGPAGELVPSQRVAVIPARFLRGGPAASADCALPMDLDGSDLTELSLEELMNIEVEVTSVSRKKERRASTPAAVHVLTAEDIRRSGAQSVAEALRLVPGLQVARLSSGGYAVSARGFAGEFANKMLVMIDGRSVYSPLFAGVYWQNQQVVLEDVERIEVVLGPGGAMWGANAVNGVINIITKDAAATQGTYAAALVGVRERAGAELRSGVELPDGGHLRVYGKYADRAGMDPEPGYGNESYGNVQGGFRADWAEDAGTFTLQGDAFSNQDDRDVRIATLTTPFQAIQPLGAEHAGGNLLARWTREREDGTAWSLQAYYDRYDLTASLVDYQLDTVDLDFQDRRRLSESHELTWGLGYRFQGSDTRGTTQVSFEPEHRSDHLFSAFVQDEYRPAEDLGVTLGVKVQHNDYTGFEVQPGARMAWNPSEQATLWAAVSRAVRTPSMADASVRLLSAVDPTLAPPALVSMVVTGDEDFAAEELTAYELGYRVRSGSRFTWDLALFLNDYDSLSELLPGTPGPGGPTGLMVPIRFTNGVQGTSWGGELALRAVVDRDWTLGLGYSHIRFDFRNQDGSDATTGDDAPRHQVFVESSHDLGPAWELDGVLYWVDELQPGVDAYTRLDLRLGYRPSEHTRLSVGAQGLFHDGEREYVDDLFGAYYANRVGAYVKLELLF